MITDDELDALADGVGCYVTYLGGDVWECCRKSDERTWYGDYAQIYQLLEDMRLDMLARYAGGSL